MVVVGMKKRIFYAIAFFALFAIEVLIALFVHDKFIRPHIGDVLVVILIYFFIRIIIPDKMRLLPLYVFAFACFTEFMQYIHIVELLGLQNNTFMRVVIGTVFDWDDIISYAVGCFLLGIYEIIITRRSKI